MGPRAAAGDSAATTASSGKTLRISNWPLMSPCSDRRGPNWDVLMVGRPVMSSAQRLPSIIAGAFVLPALMLGNNWLRTICRALTLCEKNWPA